MSSETGMSGVDVGGRLAAWLVRPRNSHFDTFCIALIVLAINDGQWLAVAVFAIVGAIVSWALQRFAGRLLLDAHPSDDAGDL